MRQRKVNFRGVVVLYMSHTMWTLFGSMITIKFWCTFCCLWDPWGPWRGLISILIGRVHQDDPLVSVLLVSLLIKWIFVWSTCHFRCLTIPYFFWNLLLLKFYYNPLFSMEKLDSMDLASWICGKRKFWLIVLDWVIVISWPSNYGVDIYTSSFSTWLSSNLRDNEQLLIFCCVCVCLKFQFGPLCILCVYIYSFGWIFLTFTPYMFTNQ